jgi:Oxidoreductase family, C-terminal alpha/beta domain/Oxidoreductase family, NAD-binding Rossmann fold
VEFEFSWCWKRAEFERDLTQRTVSALDSSQRAVSKWSAELRSAFGIESRLQVGAPSKGETIGLKSRLQIIANRRSARGNCTSRSGPVIYKDFRKLMERDDVHVIITGTPDHWNTLVNMLAVKTGKDVYTEKPLTLAIDEGKRLVKAVKASGRIVQVGSQQRSDRNFRLACELVRNGRIGKLRRIIVGLPTGPREGPFNPVPLPEGMDWDFYLGQTPKVEYNGHNSHWNFRWWYQFSGGQMTDWGAHHNNIAQWGNGTERTGPVEVSGHSLVKMIPGGYDAAAEYYIKFRYANGVTMIVLNDEVVPSSSRARCGSPTTTALLRRLGRLGIRVASFIPKLTGKRPNFGEKTGLNARFSHS